MAELEEHCWVWFKGAALPRAKGEELAPVAKEICWVAGLHFMFAVPAGGEGRGRGSIGIRGEVGREKGGDGAHAGRKIRREREAVAEGGEEGGVKDGP